MTKIEECHVFNDEHSDRKDESNQDTKNTSVYARVREFLKNNPYIYYGLGGAAAGGGIGALVAPKNKNRLLSSLLGAAIFGAAAAGGKYLDDKYNV